MLKKMLIKFLCMCMIVSSIVVFGSSNKVLADQDVLAITVGSEFIIENGGSSNLRAFPFVYGEVNGNILTGFSQVEDAYVTNPVNGMRISGEPLHKGILPKKRVSVSHGNQAPLELGNI
jgi:hypothetical protein